MPSSETPYVAQYAEERQECGMCDGSGLYKDDTGEWHCGQCNGQGWRYRVYVTNPQPLSVMLANLAALGPFSCPACDDEPNEESGPCAVCHGPERDEWKHQREDANQKELHELRASLAASQRDTERLDWLDDNAATVLPIMTMDDDEENAWHVEACDGATVFGLTLRDTIDAAAKDSDSTSVVPAFDFSRSTPQAVESVEVTGPQVTDSPESLCATCGHSRADHQPWTNPAMIAKWGVDLCYGNGDGGCPGPDCGRPTCKCNQFVAKVVG